MNLLSSVLVYQVSLLSPILGGVGDGGQAPPAVFVPSQPAQPGVSLVYTFLDVPQGYWAQDFITPLVDRDMLQGFPDGRFRPNQLMTRAEFAALLVQFPWSAWMAGTEPNAAGFADVSAEHWAAPAIEQIAHWGLMQGDPTGRFRPQQPISRIEALLTLSKGLGKGVSNGSLPDVEILSSYHDRFVIPTYAEKTIALATQHYLVVTYPDPHFLSPNRLASRAEICAFLHQLLVYHGELKAIDSPYIIQRR
jgi:S-layer homology domain